MNDSWTDVERLAAEVLASGSEESLRELLSELDRGLPTVGRSAPSSASSSRRRFPRRPRDPGLLDSAADAMVILLAVASIAIGTLPLAAPVADARPVIAEALEGITVPSVSNAGPTAPTLAVSAAERPVSTREPISLQARNLEATVGRYRAVADMYAGRKLPCSRLRESYTEVEDAWTRYSIARGRTYGDRLPDGLVRWDEALYAAVREVDRQFTASGCNRP